MKKFLSFVVVLAVAGAVSSASAMDRAGKFGLGYQAQVTTTTSANLGDWSFKYGISPNLTGQFLIGFGLGNSGFNKNVNFGAGILYDLVEKENSDFYTGLRIIWNQDDGVGASDKRALDIQIPLGWEWSFAALPEIGFNAEVGFVMTYAKNGDTFAFISEGQNVGGSLGLGVHYYF